MRWVCSTLTRTLPSQAEVGRLHCVKQTFIQNQDSTNFCCVKVSRFYDTRG